MSSQNGLSNARSMNGLISFNGDSIQATNIECDNLETNNFIVNTSVDFAPSTTGDIYSTNATFDNLTANNFTIVDFTTDNLIVNSSIECDPACVGNIYATSGTFTNLSTSSLSGITDLTLNNLTVNDSINCDPACVGDVYATNGYFSGNITGTFAGTISNSDNLLTAVDSTNVDRYVTFVSSTTGYNTNLVNTSLVYNPSTSTLTCPFVTGLASSATVSTNSNVVTTSANGTYYINFVNGLSGTRQITTNTSLSYNPSTTTLVCPFLTGRASSAIVSTDVVMTTASNNFDYFPTFVASYLSGQRQLITSNKFKMNPLTETFTTTNLSATNITTPYFYTSSVKPPLISPSTTVAPLTNGTNAFAIRSATVNITVSNLIHTITVPPNNNITVSFQTPLSFVNTLINLYNGTTTPPSFITTFSFTHSLTGTTTFTINKNGVFFQTITATVSSGSITNCLVEGTLPAFPIVNSSALIGYNLFIGNFSGSFTPTYNTTTNDIDVYTIFINATTSGVHVTNSTTVVVDGIFSLQSNTITATRTVTTSVNLGTVAFNPNPPVNGTSYAFAVSSFAPAFISLTGYSVFQNIFVRNGMEIGGDIVSYANIETLGYVSSSGYLSSRGGIFGSGLGVVLYNGAITTGAGFVVLSCSRETLNITSVLTHKADLTTGAGFVGNSRNENFNNITGAVFLPYKWGIIGYTGNSYTGTIIINAGNNTSQNGFYVDIASNDNMESCRIYFDGVLMLE